MKRINRRSGGIDFITIKEGGTGQSSIEAFRTVNKIVAADDQRIVRLDDESRLPPDAIPLEFLGAPSVSLPPNSWNGQEISLKILNYDSYNSYTVEMVTVDEGSSVYIQDGNLNIKTSTSFVGTFNFKINGYSYSLPVERRNPLKPTAYASGLSTPTEISLRLSTSEYRSPFGTNIGYTLFETSSDANFVNDYKTLKVTDGISGSINVPKTTNVYIRATHVDSLDYSSYISEPTILALANLGAEIAKPAITVQAEANKRWSRFISTSSAFNAASGIAYGGTEVQLSSDNAFSVILNTETTASTSNLSAIKTSILTGTVYIRLRHKSADSRVSEWSDVASINLATVPGTMPNVLIESFHTAGTALFVSDERDKVITINNISENNSGALRVYRKINNTWRETQTIVSPNKREYGAFGWTTAITPDGSRIIAGSAAVHAFNNNDRGERTTYIYRLDGDTYVMEKSITMNELRQDGKSWARAGLSVTISDDGIYAFIANDEDISASDRAGFTVYKREGTTWTRIATAFCPSDIALGSCFGREIAVCSDGTRIVVTASDCIKNDIYGWGAFCIYRFSNDALTLEYTRVHDASFYAAFPGVGFFNHDGSYLVFRNASNSNSNSYTLPIYSRVNSTWTFRGWLDKNEYSPSSSTWSSISRYSLDDKDDMFIISDRYETSSYGRIKMFEAYSGKWNITETLSAPGIVNAYGFPLSFAISRSGKSVAAVGVNSQGVEITNIYRKAVDYTTPQ